jgi:hypothetical protein
VKAGKLAEILLRNPDAQVYLRMGDNENALRATGTVNKVNNDLEGDEPKHTKIVIVNGDDCDWLFIADLDSRVVNRTPPVVVKSKSGKIL